MEQGEETEKRHPHKFVKAEKLRHKTLVEGLFDEGKSLYEFPLRLTYRFIDSETLEGSFRGPQPSRIAKVQMMVTVPKKKRRHAVDRVLLRRRIREAYRLNKEELAGIAEEMEGLGSISLGVVYIHNENLDYKLIERKMKKLLQKVGVQARKWRKGEQ